MTSSLCPRFISMALPPPFKAWWLCGLSYAQPPPSSCRSFLSFSSSLSHARALCPRRSTDSPSFGLPRRPPASAPETRASVVVHASASPSSSTSSSPFSASASSFYFASSLSLPVIPHSFLQVSRNSETSPQRRAPWCTSSRSCALHLSPLAISSSTVIPSPSHQCLSSSHFFPSHSPLDFSRRRQASKAPADLAKSPDPHPTAGDTFCGPVSVRGLWRCDQGSSESLGAPRGGQTFCSDEGAFVENGEIEETDQCGGRGMETSQLNGWISRQQRFLPVNLPDTVSAGHSPVCDFNQTSLLNASPRTLSPGLSASASSISSPRSTPPPFSSPPFSPPSPVSSGGCSPSAAMSSCAPLRTFPRFGRLDLPKPPQVEIRRVVVLDKVTRYELELEQRLHVLRERERQEEKPRSRDPDSPSTLPASTPGSLSSLSSPSSSSPSSSSPSSSSPSSSSPSPSSPSSSICPFPSAASLLRVDSEGAVSTGQRESCRASAETHALAAQLREQMPQAYATHVDHVRNVRELVRQLQDDWGVHTTLIKARSFGNTLSHGRRAVLRKSASAAFPPDAVIAAGGDGTLLEAASFIAALEESQGVRADGPGGEAHEDRAQKRKSGETEAEGKGEKKNEAGRGLNREVRKNGGSFSPEGIWLWGFNTDPVRSEGKLCVAYRTPTFRPRCDNEVLQREGGRQPLRADPEGQNTRKAGRETSSGEICGTGSSSPSQSHGEKTQDEPTRHSQVSHPSSEPSAPVAEATAPTRDTSFSSNAATACVSPVLSPVDGEHCVQVPAFHPRFITPRRPSPSSSPSFSSSSTSSVSFSSTSTCSASSSSSGSASKDREAETRSRASSDYVRAVLRYVMDGEGVAICRQRIRVELEYLRTQEADILQRVEQRRREHAGLMSLLPLERVDSAAVSERLPAPADAGALQRGDAAETGDPPEVVRRILGVSALNDVFIGECDSSRTCYAEVKIDQDAARRYKSSGLLVATGTGSSAWSFNMSKTRTEQVKAVAEELRRSLNLPFDSDAVDWEAVRERINEQLLFHPSMPVMRFFVREPIENSIFSCKGCAGIARRVEVLALSPDAMVAIDGLLSFPLPVGVKLILHISPFDALWTVK